MTNTNTVNIHIFLHIASSVNQNQHYCAIVQWKSMVMFMTAGPGNPLLVLEGCQNVQKEIWTKEQQQPKKKVSNVAEWNEAHRCVLEKGEFLVLKETQMEVVKRK